MIQALVIRRFNVKANGTAANVEAAGLLDLPSIPHNGVTLAFPDGTTAGVRGVLMRCAYSPRETGLHPPALEVRTATEPGERLAAVLAAGWKALEPDAVTP